MSPLNDHRHSISPLYGTRHDVMGCLETTTPLSRVNSSQHFRSSFCLDTRVHCRDDFQLHYIDHRQTLARKTLFDMDSHRSGGWFSVWDARWRVEVQKHFIKIQIQYQSFYSISDLVNFLHLQFFLNLLDPNTGVPVSQLLSHLASIIDMIWTFDWKWHNQLVSHSEVSFPHKQYRRQLTRAH